MLAAPLLVEVVVALRQGVLERPGRRPVAVLRQHGLEVLGPPEVALVTA